MTDLWSGTYAEPAYWTDTAEALIASAQLRPGMRILDLGSGAGGTLFRALDRVEASGHVTGIEIDSEWAAWLQQEIAKREIRNAENLRMDGKATDFPDNSFDAVILGMVGLDDDYDPDSATILNNAPTMREVRRVLKPGQFVYCSGWLWQDDTEWIGELVRRRLPGCVKRGYFPMSARDFSALLAFAEFEAIRTEDFDADYTFDHPAEWMACVDYMWEEELEHIKADPDSLSAFEQDALSLLADHADDNGKITYRRAAVLASAQKPLS